MTDRHTPIPPGRSEIEAEIAVADERRLRGDHENRADAAATILRWLIGVDDHVPLRGKNRGALVSAFGDVVRSREQIAHFLAIANDRRRQAADKERNAGASQADRQFARRNADYIGGVIATLEWVLSQRAEAPITSWCYPEVTAKELKAERLHADDLIEQARRPWTANYLPQYGYGEGVEYTIIWLLGDHITPPISTAGRLSPP